MVVSTYESIINQVGTNGRRVYTASDGSFFSVPLDPDRSSVVRTTVDNIVNRYLYGWSIMVEEARTNHEIDTAAYLVMAKYIHVTKKQLENRLRTAPESFDDKITVWNVGELLDLAREQKLIRKDIDNVKLQQFRK